MVAGNHTVTRIARLRRRAAWLIGAENCAAAAAPAGAILLAYIAAALFDLGNPWGFTAACLLALAALAFGLTRLRRPAPETIDRRIETASGLSHRPLATLEDEPENDTPLAIAIWRLHQQRAQAALGHARLGPPAPRAAARDRFALRLLLLLLLLTGAVVAGPAGPARLAAALAPPAWPFAGPRITAWVTPPSYVAAPPLLLVPGQNVTILTGSRLTLIVDGPRHPSAHLAGAALPFAALNATSHRADLPITASGTLAVGPWWHRLAHWRVSLVSPAAPVITLTSLAATGATVKLGWTIADPYGIAAAHVNVHPIGHPAALVQNFAVGTAATGAAAIDLSDSPFAGLPIGLALGATNIAGVTGRFDPQQPLSLPAPPLHDQTAIALAAWRQQIALDPQNAAAAAVQLGQLARTPPTAITDSADVQLANLASTLADQTTSPPAAVSRLLALIKQIEAGPDFYPAQQLAASNQALTAALERGLQGQPPTPALVQQLLESMRTALSQHLAALQQSAGQTPSGQTLDLSALDDMARKIAADEAAGRTQQAAQELQQLEQTLKNLQSARPMTAAEAAKAAAADAAAAAISQMTKAEADLLDQTHQGSATPAEQGAVQQQLNATRQSLARAGVPVPGLGQAGADMGAAGDALNLDDTDAAEDAETGAISALQQAAAALSASRANRFSLGQGQPSLQGINPGQDGPNGMPDLQSNPNLNFGAPNPARAIQQQIIHQDSDPALPTPTHDYYHRLLAPNP